MRRAAIFLAILSVASAVSVVVQGAKIQGGKVSAIDSAKAAKPAARAAGPSAVALAQDPTQYVGEAVCLTCHESQKYDGTAHALKSNDRTPAATHGCESCHGPGKAHVDSGGDDTKIVKPKAISRQESSAICTTCHDRRTHAMWTGSQHDQRNVGCVTCHSVTEGSEATRSDYGNRGLCDLQSQCREQGVPLPPHAGAGGRDDVFLVSQSARFSERSFAEDRHDDRRELHELSRRKARTVSVGACAGRQYVRHLPRSARLEQ